MRKKMWQVESLLPVEEKVIQEVELLEEEVNDQSAALKGLMGSAFTYESKKRTIN